MEDIEHRSPGDVGPDLGPEGSTRWLSQDGRRLPQNKRMKLTIVLASAPRDTEEGHSACSPFGEHRTLAAYPRCSTDTYGQLFGLSEE